MKKIVKDFNTVDVQQIEVDDKIKYINFER